MARVLLLLTSVSLAAWLYLVFFRDYFWKSDLQPSIPAGKLSHWPAVVAIVPARNEAPLINRSLAALRRQDYPGDFSIILIDDGSQDGTAAQARRAAAGDGHSIHVIAGEKLPNMWTGKVWAMHQGVCQTGRILPHAAYLWFTDADLEHDQTTLRKLVWQAESLRLDLTSNMALLHCTSFWEGLLIPAFVFFFRKLYPFRRVNRLNHPVAAAAGGSMLVRREALQRSGGLEVIRGELIDDCALARRIKPHGPIRLELTRNSVSLRPYRFVEIWQMVARTAYTQLKYSSLRLVFTVAVMILIYLAPLIGLVAGSLSGQFLTAGLGAVSWALMTLAYLPTIRLYQKQGIMSSLLPVAALLYTCMTMDSARRHWLGKGGQWKGRTQA